MTGDSKKMLNTTLLAVEFLVASAFAFSSCLLYYGLTRQSPVSPEQQLDGEFVPFLLLILLLACTSVFCLTFLIHFTGWRIMKIKEKRKSANRFV